MKPALRTCVTTDARQSSLSLKLARAANTRVDFDPRTAEPGTAEIDECADETAIAAPVEVLPVVAIPYYAVGLFGYLVKAGHDSGQLTMEPSIVTATFVPVAAFSIWWTVRRIRRKHIGGED